MNLQCPLGIQTLLYLKTSYSTPKSQTRKITEYGVHGLVLHFRITWMVLYLYSFDWIVILSGFIFNFITALLYNTFKRDSFKAISEKRVQWGKHLLGLKTNCSTSYLQIPRMFSIYMRLLQHDFFIFIILLPKPKTKIIHYLSNIFREILCLY